VSLLASFTFILVYGYLFRRVGNQADAEDLTAQTFLTALEALPRYQEKGYFAAWLFAIARSKIADHFRANKPQSPFEAAEQNAGDSDLLGCIVKDEQIARLSGLIQSLNDDEQELIHFS
jgi:RNA polymerase sigma-70 factor (ECF subfamily)